MNGLGLAGLGLGAIGFAEPWLLAALVALPAIWWLLKLTPPTARQVRFPAVALLFGLSGREEEPARTPPWLLMLRLFIAGLVIVALARPLLDPQPQLQSDGPLLIVVDNGWSAAPHWSLRLAELDRLLAQAERGRRPVMLLTTAPPASGEAIAASKLMTAAAARELVRAWKPLPWSSDRAAALTALDAIDLPGRGEVLWLSDGLQAAGKEGDGADGKDGAGGKDGAARLAAALGRFGTVTVRLEPAAERAHALLPPVPGQKGLALAVLRSGGGAEQLWLRAEGDGGRVLARQPVSFSPGATRADTSIDLPVEVANDITRIAIEGEASAGALVLLDERTRRRPVGLASGDTTGGEQPLLAERYYLRRALDPYAEVREGRPGDLLRRGLSMLVLADIGQLLPADHAALQRWLLAGGMLVRFAGPRLAARHDDLLPVRLRPGDRSLGGALTWEKPARLAPFPAISPFFGLSVPADVTVEGQVLAEPSPELGNRTWARLSDGTPLVTAERRGKGWLVLVHTTANARWSNLALSGLFVEMMQRLLGLSRGVAAGGPDANGVSSPGTATLPPDALLDGFGQLGPAGGTARALRAADIAAITPGPRHPPGLYGRLDGRLALNLTARLTALRPLENLPARTVVAPLGQHREIALMAPLLALALALILLDLLLSLWLRGLLRRRAAVLGLVLAATLAVGRAPPALAADPATGAAAETSSDADAFALAASEEFRLAYVRSGDPQVDAVSRAGLNGLSLMLTLRTSAKTAEPMAIDIEHDPILFFPLVYWPIAPSQAPLSAAALARIDDYIKHGGTILFDTRDQDSAALSGGTGPGAAVLRRLLDKLDMPPLTPVPADHVLTKAFYLLRDFPGRYAGGQVWVERQTKGYDGVSGLVIGGNDWAAAWAVDDAGRPLLPVIPGGERQREFAYRFGINLVMYCLTGSYKSDQVHVPTILERLGQ